MTRVLFVCVHNSGRSQMAEAFARALSAGALESESAGTMLSDAVNPVAVEAMREVGVDISANRPRLLTREIVERADRVITMGCNIDEACTAAFVSAEDWGLGDPAGKGLDEVRKIRDEIEARVRALLSET